jgi:hypothetical protein
MGDNTNVPRRTRVERNIYQRASGVFEVGLKDAAGKQRWRTVDGGVMAARAVRDQLLAQRHRGELTPSRPKLRFADALTRGSWGRWRICVHGRESATATRSTPT